MDAQDSPRSYSRLLLLECILHDVRFGFRMLRKHLAVTAIAVLSPALTIGAAVAAFTLIDALLLKPLPVRDPGSLYYLASSGRDEGTSPGSSENISFSYPMLQRLRASAPAALELFGVAYGGPYQNVVFDSGGKEEKSSRSGSPATDSEFLV